MKLGTTVEPRFNDGPIKGLTKFVRYKEVSLYRGSFSYTMEPRYNEPLYNEVIDNDFLYPNNIKLYEKEPRCNETSL